jgi:hypothetical protein
MHAVRVEMAVEADGELHLTHLPCRRGDEVEAIIVMLEATVTSVCNSITILSG